MAHTRGQSFHLANDYIKVFSVICSKRDVPVGNIAVILFNRENTQNVILAPVYDLEVTDVVFPWAYHIKPEIQ